MAVSLKNSFVSSATYNSLPRISEVATVSQDHSDDLNELRVLLTKHNVPSTVSVRLIHKHFDANDGEVMAIKEVTVPSYGAVYSLGPLKLAEQSSQLRPIHYYVDETGSFQAYEYTNAQVPDLSRYDSFLAEFSKIVIERGLQRKLGLKLNTKMDEAGWTELEFRDKRSTIIFPDGMPIPDGMDEDTELNITTEWGAKDHTFRRVCVICIHTCVSHPKKSKCPEELGVYLGGQKLEFGSPVYNIVNAVTEVW
ncbi:hypothetical protein McanMca71_006678 [Microsporum canis]|uniref:Uncharacterized protein n=1 Tax=Arthroderma otae (strain ATCC MYA-4605 / CBS 113480) TaxID=554155 RepID=C5FIK7_ARTOC|nr:conserved hypothetical protein [Microsporum canis CBS 113480]EEQ29276.1 conserved hypothetical protein [Microsporum canis CBS 113480]